LLTIATFKTLDSYFKFVENLNKKILVLRMMNLCKNMHGVADNIVEKYLFEFEDYVGEIKIYQNIKDDMDYYEKRISISKNQIP